MGKRIKDLTTYNKKLASQNAYFVLDNGTVVNKAEYKTIASELLSEYTGLSLGGSNQSVKTALDSMSTSIDDLEDRVSESEKALEWADIAARVATGARPYAIGDTFSETWKDVAANKTYTIPWRVNHYETLELENGKTATGMWLQMTKALPFGVPMSHQRAFLACPNGLSAGTYYITFGDTWGGAAVADSSWSFTLTSAVEKGGRLAGFYMMLDAEPSTFKVYSYRADGKTITETVSVVSGSSGSSLGTLNLNTRNGNLNSMSEVGLGWNDYEHSAMRQFLNNPGGVGAWWAPQDQWDIAPDVNSTKASFLSGLSSGFVSAMVPVKTMTYKNTLDGGTITTLYDKVTIPALSQAYIDYGNINEGEAHSYYVQLNGTDTKYKTITTSYPELIQYNVETGNAITTRMRTANKTSMLSSFQITTNGIISTSTAPNSVSSVPMVFIGG